MEDKFSLQNCAADDVLSFNTTMFKVDKLNKEVSNLLNERQLGKQLSDSFVAQNISIKVGGESRGSTNYYTFYENWFGDGIDCEILRIGGKGWKKGKVKIKVQVSLEFCPDELEIEETQANDEITQPESPLDDLRQKINKETQQ
jgi:hypothetical protein